MASAQTCSKCGQRIPGNAPLGQCPNCLFDLAGHSTPANCLANIPFQAQGRTFGDFILGRQLGSGGMGIVYEATQRSLNRKVAIKFIRDSQVASPTLLRRFTIEAEATARLHHPNIVGIHEIGEIDGQPYFSMDLVDGDSLRTALSQGDYAPMQPRDETKSSARLRHTAVARLMAKTARALHHAHQRGVLHRDVKPANILIDRQNEPHLTDFGLAKILRETTDQDTRQSLTGSGDIAGTPCYMSPEQASGLAISQAADIYGLGAVLYELLIGQPPLRGNTPLETLQKIQSQTPKTPRSLRRHIEPDLETICLKCLERDPRRRYSTAEALAEDLENWIDHQPIKARPAGPIVRITQWMHRNRMGAAFIGALILALLGTLVLLEQLQQRKRQGDQKQAYLFQTIATQLTKEWEDIDHPFVVISSDTLAFLDNRTPVDSSGSLRLRLGIRLVGTPVTFAQQYAPFFAALEANLAARLKQPVQVDLIVYKGRLSDFGKGNGAVDIAVMDALALLRVREKDPRVAAVAQENRSRDIVIMANKQLGLTNLAQLKDSRFRFHRKNDVVTTWTKAALFDAGLRAQDFRSIAYASDDLTVHVSTRDIVMAIFRGESDAGATFLRRFNFESERPPGLTKLAQVTITPSVYAFRPDLATNVVSAICGVLFEFAADPTADEGSMFVGGWKSILGGAMANNESDLQRLGDALQKASQFDGALDSGNAE